MNFKSSLLVTFFLLFVLNVSGQVRTGLINVDFKNATIPVIVADIESKTNFHFYYKAAEFDSLRVTLSTNAVSLQFILNKAFNNTAFKFSIDQQNNVFLTKEAIIIAALPYGIFASERDSLRWSSQKDPAIVAELSSSSELGSSLDNKIVQIGTKTSQNKPGNVALAGYLKDSKTGEPVIGASIFVENPRIGTYTDQFGYYSLVLPKGTHTLISKHWEL